MDGKTITGDVCNRNLCNVLHSLVSNWLHIVHIVHIFKIATITLLVSLCLLFKGRPGVSQFILFSNNSYKNYCWLNLREEDLNQIVEEENVHFAQNEPQANWGWREFWWCLSICVPFFFFLRAWKLRYQMM